MIFIKKNTKKKQRKQKKGGLKRRQGSTTVNTPNNLSLSLSLPPLPFANINHGTSTAALPLLR